MVAADRRVGRLGRLCFVDSRAARRSRSARAARARQDAPDPVQGEIDALDLLAGQRVGLTDRPHRAGATVPALAEPARRIIGGSQAPQLGPMLPVDRFCYGSVGKVPYVRVMIGRLLFATVWLIIAAGLLLPLYAPEDSEPAPAPTWLLAAERMAASCTDCIVTDERGAACRDLVALAADACAGSRGLIHYLVVEPRPALPPPARQPLPPKLPAI